MLTVFFKEVLSKFGLRFKGTYQASKAQRAYAVRQALKSLSQEF